MQDMCAMQRVMCCGTAPMPHGASWQATPLSCRLALFTARTRSAVQFCTDDIAVVADAKKPMVASGKPVDHARSLAPWLIEHGLVARTDRLPDNRRWCVWLTPSLSVG